MRLSSFWISIVALFVGLTAAAEDTRLLRFPDIHKDRVAFVYAGDIWTAPVSGGTARRLTSHEGMELFPKFSPDGRHIAYSAEYSGNRQVYVIPVEGGEPRQLTFYNDVGPMPPRGGFDYQVMDWTPDGKHVLFRGNRLPWGPRMGRPYLVPVDGGMETALAVPEGGGGMLSPDGSKLVYTPIAREFRTWKRHRGGRAQDVWIYDLKRDRSEQITDHVATDNQPVWVGDMIYFTSDRDRRLNLYAYDTRSKQTSKATTHEDFDVLWPSAGPDAVIYEAGGYLHRFDPGSGQSKQLSIRVTGDFLQTMPRTQSVADDIQSADISPSGKRALFTARGDLFTVPAKNGPARNLTRTPGVRETAGVWSPDGKHVAYLSDRSGEYEVWVRSQDGSGEERRLTRDGDTWRFPLVWSPDSKKIAFADKKQRLRYVEVEGGKIVDVDISEFNDITTYGWAPDSRWVVYTKVEPSQASSIFLYSIDDKKIAKITDGFTNDTQPVFDPEGRYLYFLSDRDYNLQFSGYEFNYFYVDPTRVYAVTLKKDGPALGVPKIDEEEPKKDPEPEAEPEKGKDDKKGKEEESDEKRIEIDFDGLADRVVVLPASPSNYGNLNANKKGLFFSEFPSSGAPRVRFYSIDKEEIKDVLPGVANYVLSADGSKLLYASRGNFGIVDAAPGKKSSEGHIDTSTMHARIDPKAEWRQIFEDGYRITRDWFYDPGMHGVDWEGIKKLYEPLVDHVAHRADLDYILGEMGGELNAGHFYVNSGDQPGVDRVNNGLLGAEIVADRSGYFRIDRIFPGENWHGNFRSPLTEAGVDVAEGEFILAVDGRSTKSVKNFYELLIAGAGRTVTLTVNDKASEDGSREVKVRPVSSETSLRYLEWVNQRREMVDKMSGGRIGYIHLPNTAGPGNRELRKFFYPQAHKDALVVDVRYNGGGFIPDRMIELLTRQPLSIWARRGIRPFQTPGFAHTGPKAALMNGYSSSGGDAFPYYFRKVGLGKLFGTRTWGGLIGLSGNPGFMDGGSLSVPTFRFIDTEGNWAVENEGVSPDVEVIDRPELISKGQDPTLEAAVKHLLDELQRNPPQPIPVPPAPKTPR
ncbi:hypothetical protein ABI59_00885 [Acidobacteria bacterium Mor1]|nr:hypothetical protein ABI59_00885 [Acidobacteria bacterium Mor1]